MTDNCRVHIVFWKAERNTNEFVSTAGKQSSVACMSLQHLSHVTVDLGPLVVAYGQRRQTPFIWAESRRWMGLLGITMHREVKQVRLLQFLIQQIMT